MGAFTSLVECQATTSGQTAGSSVKGIKFDVYAFNGIHNCAKANENVFIGEVYGGLTSAHAVFNDNTNGNLVEANDNYVDGFLGPIDFVSASATVDHNLITQIRYGIKPQAISPAFSGSITNNVIMGTDTSGTPRQAILTPPGGGSGTFSGNLCDSTSPGCALCVTAGLCSITPSAPFSF